MAVREDARMLAVVEPPGLRRRRHETPLAEIIAHLYGKSGGRNTFADFFPDGERALGSVPPVAWPIRLAIIMSPDSCEVVVSDPLAV